MFKQYEYFLPFLIILMMIYLQDRFKHPNPYIEWIRMEIFH